MIHKLFIPLLLSLFASASFARKGSTSSGGYGATPERVREITLRHFDELALFSCTFSKKAMIVDFTRPSTIGDSNGFARVRVPGESGGTQVVFFAPYEQTTNLLPSENNIRVRFGSGLLDSEGVTTSGLLVDLKIAGDTSAKLQISGATIFYTTPTDRPFYEDQSKGEGMKCQWGAARVTWD